MQSSIRHPVNRAPKALIGTTHIWVCSNGNRQEARLLFDTGSAISISQRLADTLQAKCMPSSYSIQGLGDSHIPCTSLVDIQLRPLQGNTNEYIPVRCHIVDNIMSDGYLQTDINLKELSFIKTKSPLADPHLGKQGKIDLLLGVTDVAQAFRGEAVTTGDHKTLATKTLFGWSIEGAIPNTLFRHPFSRSPFRMSELMTFPNEFGRWKMYQEITAL